MNLARNRLPHASAMSATVAMLTLALTGVHSAAAQNAAAAAAGDDVVVKGAFDADDGAGTPRKPETPAEVEIKKRYSPYAGRKYPTRVYFGDTHNHTANSGDAFMAGNRLTPEQAYRFARGEEVISSTGVPAKLSRPLDFLVVSDHAEGLGVMFQVYEGNPAFMSDPTLARWSKAMRDTPRGAGEYHEREVTAAQAQGTLPAPVKDPKIVGPIMKSVWQEYTATAEKFNEPGRFTAMIGYEWTSVPGGNNLHRNILFRDNKDKADQILPFSSWQSEDPEKLWAWMAKYEEKTGGKLLAIPHNGNLSNGRMFELVDFAGKPLIEGLRRAPRALGGAAGNDADQGQQRDASDRFRRMTSSPTSASQGWDIRQPDAGRQAHDAGDACPPCTCAAGCCRAWRCEQKLGANPFKFGFVGGTDVHNSLTAIEEDNFYRQACQPGAEPTTLESTSRRRAWACTRYTGTTRRRATPRCGPRRTRARRCGMR